MKKSPKSERKNGNFVQWLIAGFVTAIAAVLLIAEAATVICYVIPYLSVLVFQNAGIGIESGLTFAEFSVSDFVVMCMMWFFPVLIMVLLIAGLQWKLTMFVFKKLGGLWKKAISRKEQNV